MTRPESRLVELALWGRMPPFTEQEEDHLLASAVEHRMEGLLWSSIQNDADLGTGSWRRKVAALNLRNRQIAQANWEGLGQVAAIAEAMGVEVATVKGVTAEARWYERMGERPSGDVDLVLSPNDTVQATELVGRIQPDHVLIPHVEKLVDTGILQSIELRTRGGVAVDLHFDLLKLGMPARDPGNLWSHMQPFEGEEDIAVLVSDAELALLHLLLHLTKDRFRTLLAHVDVQRVVTREPIDWNRFWVLADSEGLGMHAGRALEAVNQVLPFDYKDDRHPSGGAGLLWTYLWRPSVRLRGYEGIRRFRRRQGLLPIMMPGHRIEALRFWIRRSAFPPPALQAYRNAGRGPRVWSVTGGRAAAAIRRRRDGRRRR